MDSSNAEKDTQAMDALLWALAESRARFADSEARRAELEAVIERVREMPLGNFGPAAYGFDGEQLDAILAEAPSVVLEDRDREVAARALEDAATDWHEPNDPQTYAAGDWLVERAAAIRKGDTNA